MRTNLAAFVLSSEKRKKIADTIFEYPNRQWSCSALEELTKLPHATVFRALNGLRHFGVLKSVKINKKDVLYELVADSPFIKELKIILGIEKNAARKIACSFIAKIKTKSIYSAIMYGSSASRGIKPESDIDILVVLDRHDKALEQKIYDAAAELSLKLNKTISPVVMDIRDVEREKDSQFIKSIIGDSEVIYGENPF